MIQQNALVVNEELIKSINSKSDFIPVDARSPELINLKIYYDAINRCTWNLSKEFLIAKAENSSSIKNSLYKLLGK